MLKVMMLVASNKRFEYGMAEETDTGFFAAC